MPLLLNVPTVRVELPEPGEWVDLKSRLSKGDTARIEGAAFKLRAGIVNGAAGDLDMTLDYEATVFAGMEVGIVAWSFAEAVTPANIRALDAESYAVITERANELWQGRSDNERRDLSAAGAAPPSTAGESPLSLVG